MKKNDKDADNQKIQDDFEFLYTFLGEISIEKYYKIASEIYEETDGNMFSCIGDIEKETMEKITQEENTEEMNSKIDAIFNNEELYKAFPYDAIRFEKKGNDVCLYSNEKEIYPEDLEYLVEVHEAAKSVLGSNYIKRNLLN